MFLCVRLLLIKALSVCCADQKCSVCIEKRCIFTVLCRNRKSVRLTEDTGKELTQSLDYSKSQLGLEFDAMSLYQQRLLHL